MVGSEGNCIHVGSCKCRCMNRFIKQMLDEFVLVIFFVEENLSSVAILIDISLIETMVKEVCQ